MSKHRFQRLYSDRAKNQQLAKSVTPRPEHRRFIRSARNTHGLNQASITPPPGGDDGGKKGVIASCVGYPPKRANTVNKLRKRLDTIHHIPGRELGPGTTDGSQRRGVRGGGAGGWGMKLENFVYFICNVYASRMSLTLGFFCFCVLFYCKAVFTFFCQICGDIEPLFLSIIGLVNYTATCSN